MAVPTNYYKRPATIQCSAPCVHQEEGYCLFAEAEDPSNPPPMGDSTTCICFIEKEEA